MAERDTQLQPAEHAPLDNNDRNAVRPQTQEPYGDQELVVESKVTHERHFAGQPLETRADREANEQLRREQYERAQVDPTFRHSHKIDMPDEDKLVRMSEMRNPLVSPVPDEVYEPEDDLSEDEINEAEQEYEHQLDDSEADEKEVK